MKLSRRHSQPSNHGRRFEAIVLETVWTGGYASARPCLPTVNCGVVEGGCVGGEFMCSVPRGGVQISMWLL
jgi:hypothetical protein